MRFWVQRAWLFRRRLRSFRKCWKRIRLLSLLGTEGEQQRPSTAVAAQYRGLAHSQRRTLAPWPERLLGSGRSVSRLRFEALDVGDEVDDSLVALGWVVGGALLDDPAHLIRTGLQRLPAGKDVGEHPAE